MSASSVSLPSVATVLLSNPFRFTPQLTTPGLDTNVETSNKIHAHTSEYTFRAVQVMARRYSRLKTEIYDNIHACVRARAIGTFYLIAFARVNGPDRVGGRSRAIASFISDNRTTSGPRARARARPSLSAANVARVGGPAETRGASSTDLAEIRARSFATERTLDEVFRGKSLSRSRRGVSRRPTDNLRAGVARLPENFRR